MNKVKQPNNSPQNAVIKCLFPPPPTPDLPPQSSTTPELVLFFIISVFKYLVGYSPKPQWNAYPSLGFVINGLPDMKAKSSL